MIDISEYVNNPDYDLAGEKFLSPDIYSDIFNYTLGKVFAISNEQLAQVFVKLNLNNKRVLTVGSSGDQALNAILCGCKDITIADANIFAQYYIEYKLAVIKTFDYKTFNKIFIVPEFFDWRVYAKISHNLSPKVRQFWDTLMLETDSDTYSNNFSAKSIKDKMLIIDHRDRHSKFYKDEETYNKLQRLLKSGDISIKYITAELENFPKILKQKYHYINLSNIYDYYAPNRYKFNQIIQELYNKNLYSNGDMIVHYDFNNTSQKAPKQLGNLGLIHKEISRFYDGENKTDTVWIVKKDKIQNKSTGLEKNC